MAFCYISKLQYLSVNEAEKHLFKIFTISTYFRTINTCERQI